MKPRQRLYRAITFGRPDRIPVIHFATGDALVRYGERLLEIFREFPPDSNPALEFWKPDAVPEGRPFRHRWTDEWGVTWEMVKPGVRGQPVTHPLDDWSKLAGYELPPVPPDEGPEFQTEKEKANRFKEDYLVEGGGIEYFQIMTYLRGYENLMIDFAEKRPELYELADRMEERHVAVINRFLKLGAELIGISDDWGIQTQLAASPAFWRDFFKPRYRRFIETAHDGGALIWMHSDGHIIEIIPDLIEIGLDALNCQFSCHDIEELSRVCRGRICIISDIDRQRLLPFGTPAQVRDYIKRVIDLFALPEGGLVAFSQVDADMPLENVRAMYEAWRDFGAVQ